MVSPDWLSFENITRSSTWNQGSGCQSFSRSHFPLVLQSANAISLVATLRLIKKTLWLREPCAASQDGEVVKNKIVHARAHTPTCNRPYKHLHTRDAALEGSNSAALGRGFKVTPFISCG